MRLTHNLVLEPLVLADGLTVALALMLLSVEVFDSLVVEETISVNPPSDHVAVVHLPPKLRPPSGEHNASGNCVFRK